MEERDVSIIERNPDYGMNLEFQAEFFNNFNHASFGTPGNNHWDQYRWCDY